MKLKNFENFLNEELGGEFGSVNIDITGNGWIKQAAITRVREAMKNLQGECNILVDGKKMGFGLYGHKSPFKTNEEFDFKDTTDKRGRKLKSFTLDEIEHLVKSNISFKDLRKEADYKGEHRFNEYIEQEFEFDGYNYTIHLLYAPYQDTHFECGWIIMKDEEPAYLVFIYEPYGCYVNQKRGLLTFNGHEEIVQLWLDDGEFESNYTR